MRRVCASTVRTAPSAAGGYRRVYSLEVPPQGRWCAPMAGADPHRDPFRYTRAGSLCSVGSASEVLAAKRRASNPSTIPIVVEREGLDDELVMVPVDAGDDLGGFASGSIECSVAAFLRSAALQLDSMTSDDPAEWEVRLEDGGPVAPSDHPHVMLTAHQRVTVAVLYKYIARRQVEARGITLRLSDVIDYRDPDKLKLEEFSALMDALALFEDAASADDIELVKLLMATELIPKSDTTAMLNARFVTAAGCKRAKEHIAIGFLHAGADPHAKSRDGTTAFMQAAQHDLQELLDDLLARTGCEGVDDVDRVGRTALHYAASAGNEAIALTLLAAGADPKLKARFSSRTPLMYAAEHGLHALCTELLKSGVDVDHVDTSGATALLHAILHVHEDVALSIVAAGADVRRRNALEATPLMAAAEHGLAKLAAALMAAGAEVDAADTSGRTALMYAAAAGHGGVVRDLLVAGADAGATTATGKTPLMTSAEKGHADVCAAVAEAIAAGGVRDVDSQGRCALMYALTHGHHEAAVLLLALGSDANGVNASGRTPLMYAAERGDVGMCTQLLAAGADVNAASSAKMTPLLYAAKFGHEAACSVLLSAGARADATATGGKTPLMWAEDQRNHAVVRVLRAAVAEPNAKPAPPVGDGFARECDERA